MLHSGLLLQETVDRLLSVGSVHLRLLLQEAVATALLPPAAIAALMHSPCKALGRLERKNDLCRFRSKQAALWIEAFL
jgi:hypothetical protein